MFKLSYKYFFIASFTLLISSLITYSYIYHIKLNGETQKLDMVVQDKSFKIKNVEYAHTDYDQIIGWNTDDHLSALKTYLNSFIFLRSII